MNNDTNTTDTNARGVAAHKWMAGGAKTICTSAVLAYLGIDASQYHYSGLHEQRAGVLRRHGWAVRSRASTIAKKGRTMGTLRAAILAHAGKDPAGTVYMVRLRYGGKRHAILVDGEGRTVVDTDPRKVDRRAVVSVHAVWPK
tara:strand:- start:200 stop:628 length:429 start_codon:yes stop_codon:yes gene_type:complete